MHGEDRRRAPAGRARAGLRRRAGGLGLVAVLVLASCQGDDTATDGAAELSGHGQANPGPLPTLEGGVELPAARLEAFLGGVGLAYGTPLPSQARAAQAFTEDPEISGALARTVRSAVTGRYLGELVLLRLDGREVFDRGMLAELVHGLVAGAAEGKATEQAVGPVTVVTAEGPHQTAAGYRIGDLMALATAPVAADATLIVDRGLAAWRRGQLGNATPVTPLLPPVKVDGAFVKVPSVSFVAFPPPEDEEPPVTPVLPQATSFQGRYGVVAGERRTTVWAYTLSRSAYPTAEAVVPRLTALVSSLAGGTKPRTTEVVDRMVYAADPPPDAPAPDPAEPDVVRPLVARAFLHGSLAIVVTGRHADQVDAAISDWIAHLTAP